MSQRRAKAARKRVRQLLAERQSDPTVEARGLHRWSETVLEIFFTPRERRRAEAVVARKAPKAVTL